MTMTARIIGAHDTLTAYPWAGVLSWLMSPMSKCQDKRIYELMAAGVRCFDLRLWWHGGRWHYGHGLSEHVVPASPTILIGMIVAEWHCAKSDDDDDLYIRLMLERPSSEGETRLVELCKEVEAMWGDEVTFLPAYDKKSWTVLYSFGNESVPIHEYHASVSGRGWLRYFPRWWHRRHGNGYEMQEGVNLVDFV